MMPVCACTPSGPKSFGPAALAWFLVLGACGSAVFRPERPNSAGVRGAVVALASLKVRPDGTALVASTWQADDGVAVRSVQVAPVRENACGGGAVLAHASVLRVRGETSWQRPLPITGVSVLEAELSNAERALQTDSVLEFDLHTTAGPACVRLPFASGTTRGWTPATTGALGVSFQGDQMGILGFVRPGLWVGPYRHGVEIGFGDSRGVDGRHTILPTGQLLAMGWMTERLWTLPMGFLAVSLALGYQARFLIEPPAAGAPRIAHGPRLIVRPFTFVAVYPPQLPIGGRLGYLSFLELSFGLWLSGDGQERAGTLGVGFTWDRPLTR